MEYVKNLALRLLTIADKEGDSEEQKRHHGFLIYMGLLMSSGGVMWSSICLVYGLYTPAIIPMTYIVITILNFTYLNKSKNFLLAQYVQIFISLLLPFFFQFYLGGYVASGGNVLWSVIAVFGSFTLRNKKMSFGWFILFCLMMIFSALVDPYAKEYDAGLSEGYIIFFFAFNFITVIGIIFSLYYYFVSSEEKAKNELKVSLEQLQLAQNQLIESEKMASLGSLVSGVAHEINTPLGVALTGVSQIDHEAKKIESSMANEDLTEEDLNRFIDTVKKISDTIHQRLSNAVSLVKSFKNISVDQHHEEEREFDVGSYFNDLIISLQNPIKSKQVKVTTEFEKNVVIDSFPGIFSQILSNLILNSVKHGFERADELENTIFISLSTQDATSLTLVYEDNGIGLSEQARQKIFDPFYTTKRGQGGSGLGMNIVYNLVTQKLQGDITMENVEPSGLRFIIKINIPIHKEIHA